MLHGLRGERIKHIVEELRLLQTTTFEHHMRNWGDLYDVISFLDAKKHCHMVRIQLQIEYILYAHVFPVHRRVAKPKGSRRKFTRNRGIYIRIVLARIFSPSSLVQNIQTEPLHCLAANHIRQPLRIHNMLQLCNDNAARHLEHFLIRPMRIQPDQSSGQSIVLTHKQLMHGHQRDDLIGTIVAGQKAWRPLGAAHPSLIRLRHMGGRTVSSLSEQRTAAELAQLPLRPLIGTVDGGAIDVVRHRAQLLRMAQATRRVRVRADRGAHHVQAALPERRVQRVLALDGNRHAGHVQLVGRQQCGTVGGTARDRRTVRLRDGRRVGDVVRHKLAELHQQQIVDAVRSVGVLEEFTRHGARVRQRPAIGGDRSRRPDAVLVGGRQQASHRGARRAPRAVQRIVAGAVGAAMASGWRAMDARRTVALEGGAEQRGAARHAIELERRGRDVVALLQQACGEHTLDGSVGGGDSA